LFESLFFPPKAGENNMKKGVFGRNFSRSRKARNAMHKSLLTAFLLSGKIKTTKTKVVVLREFLTKYQKIAAKDTLAARRQISAFLFNRKDLVEKMMAASETKFKETNLGARRGDNSEMVLLEMETPAKKESIVIPAEAGIHTKKGTGSPIRSGMTTEEKPVKKTVKKHAKNIPTKK